MPWPEVPLDALLELGTKTRKTLSSAEAGLAQFKSWAWRARESLQAVAAAHRTCEEQLRNVAQLLMKEHVVPEPTTSGDPVARAFLYVSQRLHETAALHGALAADVDEKTVAPLDALSERDIARATSTRDAFYAAHRAHHAAVSSYARLSRKKETDKALFEANAAVFGARQRSHKAALEYGGALNALRDHRQYEVLAALMGTYGAYHRMVRAAEAEAARATETVGVVQATGERLTEMRAKHTALLEQQAEQAARLEAAATVDYYPDPDPADPFLDMAPRRADPCIASKRGYLHVRGARRAGGRWRRCFAEVTGEYLEYWPEESGFKPFTDDSMHRVHLYGAMASAGTRDDRRFVFAVTAPRQKTTLTLQAECEVSRQEWIAVINNSAKRTAPEKNPDALQRGVHFERPASWLLAAAGEDRSSEEGEEEEEEEEEEEGKKKEEYGRERRAVEGFGKEGKQKQKKKEETIAIVEGRARGGTAAGAMVVTTTIAAQNQSQAPTWDRSEPPPKPPPRHKKKPKHCPTPLPPARSNPFDLVNAKDVNETKPVAESKPTTFMKDGDGQDRQEVTQTGNTRQNQNQTQTPLPPTQDGDASCVLSDLSETEELEAQPL